MATLVDWLYQPQDIQWYQPSLATSTKRRKYAFVVANDTRDLFLSFTSSHWTFQVQWRTRKRLSPSKASANGYDKGAVVWTDWTDWQGSDITQDYMYFNKEDTLNGGSNTIVLNTKANFGGTFGDYTEYDKWQVNVRIRAIDMGQGAISPWGEATLDVLFDPEPTWELIKQGLPTEAYLKSDWQRDQQVAILHATVKLSAANIKRKIIVHTYTLPIGTNHFAMDINRWGVIPLGAEVTATYEHYIDGHSTGIKHLKASPTAKVKPYDYDPPTVDVTTDEAMKLTVRASGYWEEYQGSISFETISGETITEELDFGTGKIAEYLYPIIGREMTITVAGIKDGGFKTTTTTLTLDAKEHAGCWWNYEDECVRAYFKQSGDSTSDDFTPVSESIKTIGRERPVVRYGIGGERSLKTSAVFLRGKLESHNPTNAESNALDERLHAQHNWIWRTSTGRWHRVSVTGISIDDNSGYPYITADVSMVEVDSLDVS